MYCADYLAHLRSHRGREEASAIVPVVQLVNVGFEASLVVVEEHRGTPFAITIIVFDRKNTKPDGLPLRPRRHQLVHVVREGPPAGEVPVALARHVAGTARRVLVALGLEPVERETVAEAAYGDDGERPGVALAAELGAALGIDQLARRIKKKKKRGDVVIGVV